MRYRILGLVLAILACTSAAQALPAGAQTPGVQPNAPGDAGGAPRSPSSHIHIFPAGAAGGAAPSGAGSLARPAGGSCYPGCDPPLVYHGGPVMPSSSIYAIFWLPSGRHYESGNNDNRFESLVKRYFGDAGNSSFYNILTQYSVNPATGATVTDGPILNSSALAGSWVDTKSYGGKGTTSNPLLDSDIQDEVTRAIGQNHWTPGTNSQVFVFTGLNVQSCTDSTHSTCTFTSQAQYCAYHGSGDGTHAAGDVIYANIPDMSNCAALLPASPNGDVDADAVINVTSHEQFEAVSDPDITAWYDAGPSGYEIGDECAWTFGPLTSGGDLTLNGHPYLVQEEWSNADNACVLALAPPTTPGAPTTVTAAGGNGQATVSWTAPASSGGSLITSYTVTSAPGGLTASASGTATSAVVSALSNGTGYTFTVTATNAVGTSVPSAASNAVTPSADVPMTVSGQILGGNPNGGNLIEAWVGGVTCTSSTPLGYSASFSLSVGCGLSGQAVTLTVNGATAGLQLPTGGSCLVFTPGGSAASLYVYPNSATNTSCATTPPSVPTAPNPPTNVTAAGGNGQATVSWAGPVNNGGSAITGYTVTAAPGGQTVPAAGSANSAVVNGLTNGTSYTFTVTATNAVGTSVASGASNAVTPAVPVLPGAPGSVTAAGGNGQATVNWVAPGTTGGSLTGYTVTAYVGGVAQSATTSVAPSATSGVVSGLVNGTAYTFTVHASNGAGNGPESAASNAVTPSADVPMTVSGQILGGNPNGGNLIEAWVGGVTCTSSTPLGYSASFSLSVGCGLSGQAVTLTVNGATAGLQLPTGGSCLVFTPGGSAASLYVYPNSATNTSCATAPPSVPTAPNPPTNVTAAGGNGQATVSWVGPVNNGGSAITGYTVTAAPGGQTALAAGSANSAVVNGLTNGTSYTFTVTATNAVGTSVASGASNAVTPAVPVLPGAPGSVTAAGGNGQATVSWVAPGTTGGSLTGYTVTAYVSGVAQSATTSVAPSATSGVVSGLVNGTAYTFTVHASNGAGNGPESAASNAVTPSADVPMTVSGQILGGNPNGGNLIEAWVGGVTCTSSTPLGYSASFSLSVGCGLSGQAVTLTVNGATAGLQLPTGGSCLVFTPGGSAASLYVYPNSATNTSCATAEAPGSTGTAVLVSPARLGLTEERSTRRRDAAA